MAHVPDFDANNPGSHGWTGNGFDLYRCYVDAFRTALQSPTLNLPATVLGNLPPAALAPGGFGATSYPATIAFSFMGPSHGWDIQYAAVIAMTAIRDCTIGPPSGIFPAILNPPLLASFQQQVTSVHICATYAARFNPRAQWKALDRAFK